MEKLNKLPDSQVFLKDFEDWDVPDVESRIKAIVIRLRKARNSVNELSGEMNMLEKIFNEISSERQIMEIEVVSLQKIKENLEALLASITTEL